MAVPQRKKSKAKRNSRRAQHDKTSLPSVNICMNCGADYLSHRVCAECGWYRGRIAVQPQADIDLELGDEAAL